MMSSSAKGILCALITIVLWSFTMIWSKVLLEECFQPFSLLITRFVLAYIVLWVICPRPFRFSGWRNEAPYILCGIFGVTLYFLAEYQALTYTLASIVGILVAVSPLITAFIVWVRYHEKPRKSFFGGLALALAGVVLVSINGSQAVPLNVFGVVFSLLGALLWALYTVAMREAGAEVDGVRPDMLQVTRRVFFWGIIAMLPCLPVFGYHVDFATLSSPSVLVNLGCSVLLASAVGYVTWNIAIKHLGALKASVFQLCIPALTLFIAALVLGDPITPMALVGVVLVVGGLAVSQYA